MTPLVLLAVGLVGGVGAIARFALDGVVSQRVAGSLPLGTFVVNITGAFVLGILVGAAVSGDGLRLAGTGAIGAFTTFSTWMLESNRLAEDGRFWLAAANVLGSLAVGIAAVWMGRKVGTIL